MCFELKPTPLPITLQPPSMPFKMTSLIYFRRLWAFNPCVQCACGSAVLALCSSKMYVLFKCLFSNASNHHLSYFPVVKDECFCIWSGLDTGGFFVSLCCVRLWCFWSGKWCLVFDDLPANAKTCPLLIAPSIVKSI